MSISPATTPPRAASPVGTPSSAASPVNTPPRAASPVRTPSQSSGSTPPRAPSPVVKGPSRRNFLGSIADTVKNLVRLPASPPSPVESSDTSLEEQIVGDILAKQIRDERARIMEIYNGPSELDGTYLNGTYPRFQQEEKQSKNDNRSISRYQTQEEINIENERKLREKGKRYAKYWKQETEYRL